MKKLIIFLIVFISVFLLIGLSFFVLSTIGYSKYDSQQEEKQEEKQQTTIQYKGIQFNKEGEYWNFKKEDNEFIIKNNPNNMDDINFSNNIVLANYYSQPLYFVGMSENLNYFFNNFNKIASRTQIACLEGMYGEDCNIFPSKKCSDDNIIVFKEPQDNEEERIYLNEKCIFIIAEIQNQELFADFVLLKMLNI